MTDKEYIEDARRASNAAIAARDADGVTGYYTDDIIVVSGEGGKHSGKKNLSKVWKQMFAGNVTLFERLPAEVIIADGGTLAWESGEWRYANGAKGGRYSAMWCKIKNEWKTKAELFVSLD